MRTKSNNNRFDLREYVKENLEYQIINDKIYVSCPFHGEKTPSCIIHEHGFYCFGCGEKGNYRYFVTETKDNENSGRIRNADTKTYSVSEINKYYIEEANKRLLSCPDKVMYLENRCVGEKTIRNAKLGYVYSINYYHTNPRYVIPIYDLYNKKVVSARYRIDPNYDNKIEPKYISHFGCKPTLYNSHLLLEHDTILYVGSQFDAAFLWHEYQIPAVCPPSENTFLDDWIILFAGKNVLLWLDNDKTGYNSMVKIYNRLCNVSQVQIYTWRNGFKNGDDFTDFFKSYGINGLEEELKKCKLR